MDGTEVAQLRKKKVADLMYQTDIVKIRRNMPLIQTPLSRFAETWGTFQNSNCGELELDYVRCVSRIGQQEAAINPLCMKYQDDLNECLYRRKTVSAILYTLPTSTSIFLSSNVLLYFEV